MNWLRSLSREARYRAALASLSLRAKRAQPDPPQEEGVLSPPLIVCSRSLSLSIGDVPLPLHSLASHEPLSLTGAQGDLLPYTPVQKMVRAD